MLTIEKITKIYPRSKNKVVAVKDISLTLKAGDFIAVRGPSGCGKSTLLLAAGGLLEPDQGEVRVDNQNIYKLTSEERAKFRAKKIGFVFQQFHLVPYLNVLENILVPSVVIPSPEIKQRALELIEHFKLNGRQSHLPSELSTGEQQRTALARALLNRPKLILADEPTGNLDEENAKAVLDYLSEFCKKGGAVLLVTHDSRAASFVQRTIYLRDGKISEGVVADTQRAA
jgi:putative ABC transport system ATP-binding protein